MKGLKMGRGEVNWKGEFGKFFGGDLREFWGKFL